MNRLFLPVILAIAYLLAMAQAHATSSLSFEGGGYWIDLEIGHVDQPVVASVRFHAPGDPKGVVLRGQLDVRRFDTAARDLVIDYKGGDAGVAPFTLKAHGGTATLRIGDTKIESAFDWSM